ncbi:MAG: prepilin-type N-terminal cleavage/methylation domain-containing protein [Nitrospirae bacterium]|nr:prepilin-type N-terminal cleavage/methylation domain-containing protein [Nitrospirota bacterium]
MELWQRPQGVIIINLPTGFTLLEVLISLTLLSIILGAVYSSFFTVSRAIERFNGVSMKYHEARTALDIMRREVEAAILRQAQATNRDEKIIGTKFVIEDKDYFGKQASRLDLTAFSSKGMGLNTVSYYIEEKDGILTLLKREFSGLQPDSEETKEENPGYVSEVIDKIEGFSVDTLFNDQWVKTWDTKTTGHMPEIVRLSIEFNDNRKKVKLTEYARPMVGKQL